MIARKKSRTPARSSLVRTVTDALEDMKAVNVRVMDVRGITDIADCMIVASGNSDRHVRSIADRVVERAKAAGFRPYGREGERDGEWVLVDLNDVIVHVMLPRVREFYGLESLWDQPAAAPAAPAKRRAPAKATAKSTARAKGAGTRTARKPAAKAAPRGTPRGGGTRAPRRPRSAG